jgi:hypothetical protein
MSERCYSALAVMSTLFCLMQGAIGQPRCSSSKGELARHKARVAPAKLTVNCDLALVLTLPKSEEALRQEPCPPPCGTVENGRADCDIFCEHRKEWAEEISGPWVRYESRTHKA